jgi:hypothetical protein
VIGSFKEGNLSPKGHFPWTTHSGRPRHDDVVIQRRVRVQDAMHAVTQVYAVTYPGHDDHGTESRQYEDAELVALEVAEARRLSVWYEESPQSGAGPWSRRSGIDDREADMRRRWLAAR